MRSDRDERTASEEAAAQNLLYRSLRFVRGKLRISVLMDHVGTAGHACGKVAQELASNGRVRPEDVVLTGRSTDSPNAAGPAEALKADLVHLSTDSLEWLAHWAALGDE